MKKRTLIISHELVGARMAGPGIRFAQLARALAAHVDVTLAVPQNNADPLSNTPFQTHAYARGNWATLRPAVDAADTVLASPDSVAEFPATCGGGKTARNRWLQPAHGGVAQ